MSVLAMVVVTQWAEAELAATPIDGRPWIAHLVDRLRQAQTVAEVSVVCQPACYDVVAPHVPADTPCVVVTEPLRWAARQDAVLVADVPVWQLFADPRRLDALAMTPYDSASVTCLRAVLDHDHALALSGGADVTLFTRHGLRLAAAGGDVGPGRLDVPCAPAPPELRLRGVVDAAWGATLQRALLAHGCAADLGRVDDVLTRDGLHRVAVWRDGAGRAPRRVLTVRCLPDRDVRWLLAHLGHLPGVELDVVTPAHLAAPTALMPGVHEVIAFAGRSFDLAAVDTATLRAIRERRYDLCVIPRRTPCGRGFENVTPLGAASGAGLAVWMDLTGATGVLSGRPYGWEPWVSEAPPWAHVDALSARARTALAAFTGAPADGAGRPAADVEDPATVVAGILRRLDETITCHALVDAVDHGLDLDPAFVHQMPGVAAANALIADLAVRPCRAAVAASVAQAWRAAIAHVAAAPAGPASRQAGDEARRYTDAIAAAAHAVAEAEARSASEARALVALDRVARSPVDVETWR